MKQKIKKILSAITFSGILSIGTVNPIVISSCGGKQVSVPVESVQLNENELELAVGSTYQLTATVYPETATNKNVTWKSSDEKVATVDQTGLVCAVRMGNATITVTTEDGGKTATCEVTVKLIPVESVQLDKNELELAVGSTYQLTATVLPENATNKNVTWSSSDTSIVEADQTGLVKAVSEGTAIITVTTEDGGQTAKCEVTALFVHVKSIKLDKTKLEINAGETGQLTAIVLPENASNKKVTWKSNNDSVAKVDQDGLVAGIRAGIVGITVTTEDSGKIATCLVNIVTKPVPVESVTLNKNEIVLSEGKSEQLTATILPENATNKKVTWESSDNDVATVENGLVKAVKTGEATITVTTQDGGKTAKCEINVIEKTVPVDSIQLNKSELELVEGQTEQLTATILPEDATNKNVTWSSNDESIATVNQNGLVTAVHIGKVTITVTTEDGSKTATCEVNIIAKPIPVESVKLDISEKELFKGETVQLIATVLPEDATNKKVTWISSDKNIATVNEDGIVYAVRVGKAIITVITNDGGKTAKCEINVIEKTVPVDSIQLNKSELELVEGQTEQLTATILPEDATNKNVTWSSNDESIATVNQNGLVTAVHIGKVTITVTTEDGSKTATCEVNIIAKPIPVESVKLDNNKLEINARGTGQLTATVLPENATNKKVTWSSNNDSVAKVDQDGLVTAVSISGIATITVTTIDGGHTATCQITVKSIPVESIKINEVVDTDPIKLNVGETKALTVTVLPENATNKKVFWFSTNPTTATVSQDGLVTGVNEGFVTINVSSDDGRQTTSCVFAIIEPVTSVELNKSYLELFVTDGTEQLTATVLPENATNKKVTWSSDNLSVATVDQTGLVTIVGVGKATITVTSQQDSSKTATCEVVVKPIPVEGVKLDISEKELIKGGTVQLTATVLPETATDKDIHWDSSDSSVAKVNQKGLVTTYRVGTATITVTTYDGGYTATCQITVKSIPVESVSINKDTLKLVKDQTEQLIATVLPENAANKEVTWSTSDEKVATVDQHGFVTATNIGTATITVITKDGGKTDTCKVNVGSIHVESVKLNKSELKLVEGETEQLTATVLPETATNKKVTWSSADQSVAKVDQKGTVSAVSLGTTIITVTTVDGKLTAKCTIEVVSPIRVIHVRLDQHKLELENKGKTEQLTATILPEDATNKKVTWSSNDESIATVDQTGLITAVGVGTAIITVTTQDGGYTDTCDVIVGKKIDVASVSMNKDTLELELNASEQLIATVLPENASNKKVIWSSSNYSIAIVDHQIGLVTAVGSGEATITVTTEDGGKEATCKVIVFASVERVSINKDTLKLVKDQTEQLIATVLPENAANKEVTWSTSDEKVATVDQHGFVTATNIGTATITATTKDGGKTATCKVNVGSIHVEGVKLDKNELELAVGDAEQLTATVLPETATNKKVTWSSADQSVAKVDQKGTVSAVSLGTTIITVTTVDGKLTAKCTIEVVSPIRVIHVRLDQHKLELENKGKTEQLTATILPEDATNKNVTWSSSDEKVATVDKNGLVTAVSDGIATITVTAQDGGTKDTCDVIVGKKIDVASVSMNKDTLELELNASEQLIATVLPEDATNKNVTWSSSNYSIVKVDQDGLITAVNPGNATITVTTRDGGKEATCKVTVFVPVESISLNKNELILDLKISKYGQLEATVLPETATYKDISWASSDSSVATVDKNGSVTAISPGEVTITVTSQHDSSKTNTCKVTVKPISVESVSLDRERLEIANKGETEQLTATISPEDATNKKVTWSSSDKKVATVDLNGLVTAISDGNAIITVTTQDGSKTATCKVIVGPVPVESIKLDESEIVLNTNSSKQLIATVLPETAADKNVTWSSNDEKVATVDQTGLVTAVGPGITNIIVTTADGGYTATCEVTALFVNVKSVKLDKTNLELVVNQEGKLEDLLKVTVLPEDATDKSIVWASSNPAIVTVQPDGSFKAVKDGTVTIYVSTVEGARTAKCDVTVKAN